MPKIDWRDDDQPRAERFARARRRPPLASRPTRANRWDRGTPALLAVPELADRRPLHLIWGAPEPRTP